MTDIAAIATVLHEAAETHHVVWRITDGDDPTGRRGTRTGSSTSPSSRRCSAPSRSAAISSTRSSNSTATTQRRDRASVGKTHTRAGSRRSSSPDSTERPRGTVIARMEERLLSWYGAPRARPAVAQDARPVRDPRLGGDAAADAGGSRRPALPRLARALADGVSARRCTGGRRDSLLAGARLQPASARAAPCGAGDRERRLAGRPDAACRASARTRRRRSGTSHSGTTSCHTTSTLIASNGGRGTASPAPLPRL